MQITISAAIPTISLDKTEYGSADTSIATLDFTTTQEKNDPYNVTWYFANGTVINGCTYSGTSTANPGTVYYENCLLPEISQNHTGCYATHWINTPANSATYYFNLTYNAPTGLLTFSNIKKKSENIFKGEYQAIRAFVTDNNSQAAVGFVCDLQIRRPDETPIDIVPGLYTDSQGEVYGVFYIDPLKYDPGGYQAKISCWCQNKNNYACDGYGGGISGTVFTTFNVASAVTTHYLNESIPFMEVDKTEVFAGFDDVKVYHNRTNNYGDVMQTITSFWVSSTHSEQDYHFEYLENEVSTINLGNTMTVYDIPIDSSLPDGEYRVEMQIYYYRDSVLKTIRKTFSKSFNVTSVTNSSRINNFYLKNNKGQQVNMSATPFSTRPEYFIVEDEEITMCMNITNYMDEEYLCSMRFLNFLNSDIDQDIPIVKNYESLITGFNPFRTILPGTAEYCRTFLFPFNNFTSGFWRIQTTLIKGKNDEVFDCSESSLFSYYFWIEDKISIKNITTDKYLSGVNSCTYIHVNITYDYWGNAEDKYTSRICLEDTTYDKILVCDDHLVDFDYGENNTLHFEISVPFIEHSSEGEVDITFFAQNGDILEFGDTEPYNTFDLYVNNSYLCTNSLEQRNTKSLENIITEINRLANFTRDAPNYSDVFSQLVSATQGNIPINYTNVYNNLVTATQNNQPINYSGMYSLIINSIDGIAPINYTTLYQNLITATQNNQPIDYTSYWTALTNSIDNQTQWLGERLMPINYSILMNQLITATQNNRPLNYSTYLASLISATQANAPINYTALYQNLITATQNNSPIDYTSYWTALTNSIDNQTDWLAQELVPINYSNLMSQLINSVDNINISVSGGSGYNISVNSINYTGVFEEIRDILNSSVSINYSTYWQALINSIQNSTPINYTNIYNELKTAIENNEPIDYSTFFTAYQNSLEDITLEIQEFQQGLKIHIKTPGRWIANNTYTVYASIQDFAGNQIDPATVTIKLTDSAGRQLFYNSNPPLEADGVYKMHYEVPANVIEGDYMLIVSAKDGELSAVEVKDIEVLLERPASVWRKIGEFFVNIWLSIKGWFS